MKKAIILACNVSEVDNQAKQNLEKAGFDVKEYPVERKYTPEELVEILRDADAVIAGLEKYTREVLEQLPRLKLIARRGVGIDNIDLTAANEHHITVTRTEGYVGPAVAELIMAYILDHARQLSFHNEIMKNGNWSRILTEGVKGKSLGLVGFGSISKETAVRAHAFGMNLLCYYRHRDLDIEEQYHAMYTDFDTLISTSDYIAINVPMTEATKNMFHAAVFQSMKPSSVLINTARGGIVHTADLANALKNGQISAAYIDVFDQEPCTSSPLHSCNNALLTPHIGTFTRDTFISMNNRCAEQIIEFFNDTV
ncbi:MAG: glyoxylate reductase [Herbinix sp.]|jgi:D-3-phosphoglycerate dehydrogenase|nr:glyoxylate reductase [Herbinix sp.]